MSVIAAAKSDNKSSMPWHAWVIGLVLLLFGLASVFDYIMSISQGEEFYRASGMNDMQVVYFSSFPLWTIAAWTMTVWGGLLGSIALLLRSKLSPVLYAVALLGNILYDIYVYALSAGIEAMGFLWFMPMVVTVITAVVIPYASKLAKNKVNRLED